MPRIQMTRTVRIALFCLRVYLVLMLLLIGFKFFRDFSRSGRAPASVATGAAAPAPSGGASAPAGSP